MDKEELFDLIISILKEDSKKLKENYHEQTAKGMRRAIFLIEELKNELNIKSEFLNF